MADKKISQLSSASTPVAGTEVLPIVQSSSTVKVSIDNLTKGRVVNALTFDTDVAAAAVTLTGTTLAADGTDANININVTPKGTGEVALPKVNIDGGAIDGVTIGTNAVCTDARVDNLKLDGNTVSSTSGNLSLLAASNTIFVETNNELKFVNPSGTASSAIKNAGGGSLSLYGYTTEMLRINETTNVLAFADLKFNTAGQGIDFAANTHAAGMTSEKLTWYEEGTWTATLNDGSATVNLGTGYYTRMGRVVNVILNAYDKSMAGLNTANDLYITGLPFTPSQDSFVAWVPFLNVASTGFMLQAVGGPARILVRRTNNNVDNNTVSLSVFGSPANMSWFFNLSYIV
jgi:hypothetical protein